MRIAKSPVLVLLILVANFMAAAQVASHAPVVIQASSDTSVSLQPVGRPLVRVNGAVLTDRDLLREMFTIFPYARVHNGFPKPLEADIRNGAMQMIIFEELVYQEAQRRHMTVPPADLARAQAEFDHAAATRTYQQLLDLWKNADPDFIPAQEARRELAALSAAKN